jgi:hypothetical protein
MKLFEIKAWFYIGEGTNKLSKRYIINSHHRDYSHRAAEAYLESRIAKITHTGHRSIYLSVICDNINERTINSTNTNISEELLTRLAK